MSHIRSCFIAAAYVATLLSWGSQHCFALGEESFGPVGKHIGRSGDWPRGVEDILRHPARVYGQWVNGNEHIFFDADIKKMSEILERYSKVDLQVHHVTILPERGTTHSFRGLEIEHNIEFALASGIYLHYITEKSATGLYDSRPRLTLYIDHKLMSQLDQLVVPKNIQLHATPYRIDDMLRHVEAADKSLRRRAFTLLSQVSSPNEAVLAALKKAASDKEEDATIKQLAVNQLAKLEQVRADPQQRALRQYVSEFLRNHPQRVVVPTADELLKIIHKTDAKYRQGCTIRGTAVESTISGRGRLVAWTVAMNPQQLVVQRQAITDERHPPAEDLLENTIYVGPEMMGTIHRSRLWVDGKLIATKPHATFEPVGSTYDLLIGRVVWPTGRGFSPRIDEVTKVTPLSDGTWQVLARHNEGHLPMRWELIIDPRQDYLVRTARAFRGDSEDALYMVENLGIQRDGEYCTAHTARWSEGNQRIPKSIAINSIMAKADSELIQDTHQRLSEMK